ncbi:MAG: hypothetical protein ABFS41_18185 [Myxococcota bacterium]
MTKLRSQGPPGSPPPLDTDLVEFALRTPHPSADPTFQEELRAGLWQLLRSLLARFGR